MCINPTSGGNSFCLADNIHSFCFKCYSSSIDSLVALGLYVLQISEYHRTSVREVTCWRSLLSNRYIAKYVVPFFDYSYNKIFKLMLLEDKKLVSQIDH